MAEQLPFDLGHREAFARDDFWVSSCNADAIAWVDKWPAWDMPALVVYGPEGCGKTHLGHVIKRKAEDKIEIVDDADLLCGDKAREEDLFHRYNRAKENGTYLFLTAKTPPRNWNFTLPDLKSRVLACPAVEVGAPDDQLMAVVLAKLFSDRQIFVSQDVVTFVLSRVERSFQALRALVTDIDRKALSQKRAITVPLVRDVMEKKLF